MGAGRSLAETPTSSVATVFVCFPVERSFHRLGKWLHKTKRKPMLASLEKIREELMLLGLISLVLSQTVRWISKICVPSFCSAAGSTCAPKMIFQPEARERRVASSESDGLRQHDSQCASA